MTRKPSAQPSEVARIDVYQEVTNQIITLLEAGSRPWSPRWGSGAASLPLRHEGTAYRGVNVLLLWSASMSRGYTNPYWMTYRQASELGGQVRKGEKGNLVVHAGTFTPMGEAEQEREGEEGEDRARSYLKKYVVFNVEQIDGLDMSQYPVPVVEVKNRDQRDAELDAAFARYGVPYTEGSNEAYYMPATDSIRMPLFADFKSGNAFYATLAHETVHSSGHKSRLDRETLYQYRKSTAIRATEELVALSGQSAPHGTLQ
ncbi:Antirestriction protein ArdC [Sphingobium herbicidovorans NBRC 16415]|uniref:Antirestriction protein ArdC n=2 Tax=Sphingobium herbicidovorans TaxID=76947 RepID=A0A086P9N0_SPHHM|nr:ArdC-like ssDNA-binding domain-containing protein [Sphingobium herbicidovorans]KFG90098.1 Antirestriction protein ArdC [Sphingobium herbicidovorans NBRC 16415]